MNIQLKDIDVIALMMMRNAGIADDVIVVIVQRLADWLDDKNPSFFMSLLRNSEEIAKERYLEIVSLREELKELRLKLKENAEDRNDMRNVALHETLVAQAASEMVDALRARNDQLQGELKITIGLVMEICSIAKLPVPIASLTRARKALEGEVNE